MEIINMDEVEMRSPELMKKIDDGVVFIHPTDTIYGIGCSALDDKAVSKLRQVKRKSDMPFPVIAPSKQWIVDNCIVTKEVEKYLDQLPGPLMLILKLKNKKSVSKHVTAGADTIGVRIPNHWISQFVAAYGSPVVSTSANVAGKEFMTSLEDIDPDVKTHMVFCMYEGEKKGRPSTIINLEGKETTVKKR